MHNKIFYYHETFRYISPETKNKLYCLKTKISVYSDILETINLQAEKLERQFLIQSCIELNPDVNLRINLLPRDLIPTFGNVNLRQSIENESKIFPFSKDNLTIIGREAEINLEFQEFIKIHRNSSFSPQKISHFQKPELLTLKLTELKNDIIKYIQIKSNMGLYDDSLGENIDHL